MLALYVFTPCLVFQSLSTSSLNLQYVFIIVFAVTLLTVTIIIVKIYAKIRKQPLQTESGLILSSVFMNSGNFGMPVILFAYGEIGLEYAISFFVTSQILFYSVGLYYSVRGGLNVKNTVKAVCTNPMIFAVIFALIFNVLNIQLPGNLFTMIAFIGDAAIPCVMVVLGMQLAQIKIKNLNLSNLIFVMGMRLFLAPFIAFGLTQLLGVEPLLQKILIIMSALPTASTAALLAIQYDSDSDLVSGSVLITTIVSMITISALISLLGS